MASGSTTCGSASQKMQTGTSLHVSTTRAFASVEAKMIISALLMKYDFKLKDGEETPREFLYQGLSIANATKEILIRDRVDV
jgi:hypothetical protein